MTDGNCQKTFQTNLKKLFKYRENESKKYPQ